MILKMLEKQLVTIHFSKCLEISQLVNILKEEAIEWAWEFLTDEKWIGFESRKTYLLRFIQKMKKHMKFGRTKLVFQKNELFV